MTSSTPDFSRLLVGTILRPHGVRGEVVVGIRTDSPEQRFVAGSAYHTDPATHRTLTLQAGRWHQGRLLAFFEGVTDRDQAEALRGTELWVDASQIEAPTDPDEFNDHQLVGLAVETVRGEPVGIVERIEHAPASDLLVVRKTDDRTALVPFVRAIVPTVDLAGNRVVIDPPGGLLDL